MVPAGPLMIEHRLIEKIIPLVQAQVARMDRGEGVDAEFIASATDFFRTYTDHCHHGKEEDILFRKLAEKPLVEEQRQTMEKLIQDHVRVRGLIGQMLIDKDRHCQGVETAQRALMNSLRNLASVYPAHIETEDNHFFLPCMEYLSVPEQKDILARFAEYDQKLIHEKYRLLIEDMARGCSS